MEDDELRDMIHNLGSKIDLLQANLRPYLEKVDRHERLLYRQNGTPGLVDAVEKLVDKDRAASDARKQQSSEDRKFRYTIIGGVLLLFLDIATRLPWIDIFETIIK